MPTLRQLQFLVALADRGAFGRAAEAVHVTQPTLSAGIKELELDLGAQLVERESRGARLTSAGREAAARSRDMLERVDALANAAQSAGEPLTGVFRLGVIPTIAPYLLPTAAPALQSAFPKLKLYLREDLTYRLLDALRARELDAAVIALPYAAAGVETVSVREDEFLLVAPPGHALLSADTLNVDALPRESLLLLEDGHCLRDHALAACGGGAGQRSEFAATSLATLVQLVAAGYGVTLAPKLAVDAGLTASGAVAVRAFDPPVAGREIGVAWRRGSAQSEAARAIAAVLSEL
ncbi:MAG: hydrogen peroxide-inducible genes activator [Maricaulaceae bacterium]